MLGFSFFSSSLYSKGSFETSVMLLGPYSHTCESEDILWYGRLFGFGFRLQKFAFFLCCRARNFTCLCAISLISRTGKNRKNNFRMPYSLKKTLFFSSLCMKKTNFQLYFRAETSILLCTSALLEIYWRLKIIILVPNLPNLIKNQFMRHFWGICVGF